MPKKPDWNIDMCYHCNYWCNSVKGLICVHPKLKCDKQLSKTLDTIPDWCPLEDAEETT